jgi:hypothetical protein
MLNNVRDFGATGDGVVDDRVAIQAAIDDAAANDKAGIFVPSGTYRVSRPEPPAERWSLDLNGVTDFMIAGEGPKSVVKLMDTAARTSDWHVFVLRNSCRRVTFDNLVVDGNRTGLTDPNEQSHGIEVEDGTEDLVIHGCIVRDCFGDGVRLLGTAAQGGNVRRVRLESCLLQTNKRSGIGIQRALEQIIVTHCFIDATVSDQSIDFEPSGSDAPTALIIEGCIINHTNRGPAVTLTGIRGADPVVRVKFSNNIVLGGSIFCVDVDQLTIQGNVVLVPEGFATNRIPIQVQRGGDSVVVTGNLLVSEEPQTGAVISLSEVNERQVSRAIVGSNLCFARAGNGIQVLSSDDVAVEANMVVATGACGQGIVVSSESSHVDHVSVRNNDITVEGQGAWDTGIRFAAPDEGIGHLSIVGNSIHGASQGVVFRGPGFQQTPLCALNRLDAGVAIPLVGLVQLPEDAVVVGGAASRGGTEAGSGVGRQLMGLGNPNGKVIGNVGDIYQRIDTEAGARFFVKESDEQPDGGWTAK